MSSDVKVSTNAFVYATLKQWILTGRLRPGNKLIPQELANALDVSRTPIRESLERLHQEGYAGRQPRRGYFVVEIDTDDVRDLYETREALELFALNQTLQNEVAAADIAALRKTNVKYAKMFGPNSGLTHDRLQLDRAFHLQLAELSGNRYLCGMLDATFEKLIFKRRVDGSGPLPSEAPFKDHEAVIDALETRNVKKATQVLSHHIQGGCDRLLRYLHLENKDRESPVAPPRKRNAA
jgi:DNA-binding GntR family transcriptional regulator